MAEDTPCILAASLRSLSRRQRYVKTLRLGSGLSLVLSLGLYGFDWPIICLGCLAVLLYPLLKRSSESALGSMVDRIGGFDGLVECAIDNRDRSSGVALAQRQRAISCLKMHPLEFYVPRPRRVVWLPVLTLCAVVFLRVTAPAPQTENVIALTNSVDMPGETNFSSDSGPSDDDSPRHRDGDRSDVLETTNAQIEEPEFEEARPTARAGVGIHAGKSSGGEAGRRIVGFETNGTAIELMPEKRIETTQDTGSKGAVAGPARPYPVRYHTVINTWLKRRGR